ncbi:LOW QUALITY PROTEIN: rRNA methylase, partial [Streptomyces sp. e14]
MTDPLRDWHRLAGTSVLLDGFHALKHAVRFGAEVPVAVAVDRRTALALADELAPDVRDALDALLTEVEPDVYASLVPRPHPTAVAALAVRPSREAGLRALAHTPRSAPVVVLDQPRNLGNAGAVIRLAAGFGVTGVVTTGTLDPWHPTVVRGGAGLHFATTVERLSVAELPDGPLFALDPEGEDISRAEAARRRRARLRLRAQRVLRRTAGADRPPGGAADAPPGLQLQPGHQRGHDAVPLESHRGRARVL